MLDCCAKTMNNLYACEYCGKADILTRRGLTQHIANKPACKAKHFFVTSKKQDTNCFANEYRNVTQIRLPQKNPSVEASSESTRNQYPPSQRRRLNNGVGLANELVNDDEEDFGPPPQSDSEESNEIGITALNATNSEMLQRFRKYVSKMLRYHVPFTQKQRVGISLMWQLRGTKASLDMYESLMEWHLRARLILPNNQTVGSHPEFISRQRLFKFLFDRYNLVDKINICRQIVLPFSKASVKIVMNDAKSCIQSLLTDPRITDEDYLFFDDDPRASPPHDLKHIGDINTGLAYLETYKKLIKRPGKQVLLPIIFYIDGAETGQFANLPVTAVKFTLGIFNRAAREKPHMWRTLGYLPVIQKTKSRGRRQLVSSLHNELIRRTGRHGRR